MTGVYSLAGSRISPTAASPGPGDGFLDEYIFLILHPCCRSNCSRSACVNRTAYATPLVSLPANLRNRLTREEMRWEMARCRGGAAKPGQVPGQ